MSRHQGGMLRAGINSRAVYGMQCTFGCSHLQDEPWWQSTALGRGITEAGITEAGTVS